MSKSSFKSTPDDPTPKHNDHLTPKPKEGANTAAPDATEKELSRFRWSLLVWILGFGFIWAILMLEGINVLFNIFRRAIGGG
jgi:hypothetical protein